MIGRIFKIVAFAAVAAGVAGVMIARSKLDHAARAAAEQVLAGASGVEHGPVHARVWPPAAIVEDVRIHGAAGAKLVRAQRLVLPIALWGIAATPARLEHWTMELRVPRAGVVPARTLLGGEGLPALATWDAEDGRVELRAGDAPASASLVLTSVRVTRRGDTLHVEGNVEGGTGT
ncbi:MAG TPA: hypothetical protein VMV18_04300, partial [bacterium]|nr:hypothetical protein [bacterium]